MKILFCTDGSKISFDSLKNFAEILDQETIVDTICVIDWSFLPDNIVVEESGFVSSCRNVADSILQKSSDFIKEIGLTSGDMIKQCGSVVETILEQLSSVKYDFLVLGSHGKKGFQRWLGSVSRDVLNAAMLPVYISKRKTLTNRVLFTTDGSDFSKSLVEFSIKNLNLTQCEIYICSVVETPELLFLEGTLDSNWLLAIQTQQEIYAEHALNNIKKIFVQNGFESISTKVIFGIPAKSIIDYINEVGIDLVIMGTHVKTEMRRFLLDSVSKRVVEHTSCDTLIIKKEF